MRLKSNCSRILKHFGTTSDHHCAGWIYPDGKMLDLCTRLKHRMPHVQIGESVRYEHPFSDFMKECHTIRLSYVRGGDTLRVQSRLKPTPQQAEKIAKILGEEDILHFYAERYPEYGALEFDCEYKTYYPKPLDVQRWISKCW